MSFQKTTFSTFQFVFLNLILYSYIIPRHVAATLLTFEVLDEVLWAGVDWPGVESLALPLKKTKSTEEEC